MGASVSIIIPNLSSPLIVEVVRSVRAQVPAGQTVEVIVAGFDGLGLVGRMDARHISTGVPLWAGAARNLGVRAASGDVIVFIDADCLPEPGWLATLLAHMEEDRVAVSGAIRIVPDSYFRLADNVASFHEFTTALPPAERPFLPSFSLALQRRAFDEIGWFDERLPRSGGEDLDFTIRLRRAGYRLRFDPAAAVVHRPARVTLADAFRHAFRSGANSIQVRRRYPDAFGLSGWFFKWPLLLACSPLLAGAVTGRALYRNREVRAHWLTLPVLFLSRLAWCLGACRVLQSSR